ncbi:MAG TPA: polysaccharide biosynthesis/export family protein [Cytophagaceae bacterium]|jgi:polysaccharide export outer membrane protein|nr:polysaccharide biosynthesis/export family protein [Cytophagaceae bacterium]
MIDSSKNKIIGFVLLTIIVSVVGCRNHSRMFSTEKSMMVDSIQKQIIHAEKNYVIRKNDYLNVKIYTNQGERLIDPNSELAKGASSGGLVKEENIKYLVRTDGNANLPMLGDVHLEGFTLIQADSLLAIKYGKFYEGAFVITTMLNKRVFVLGPFPLGAKVIPLQNENINLIEVITLYGGIPDNGKAYNIRVIRGDLKNPNVNIIDLSTIDGMKKANLDVQPNDIIYIEPVRKLFLESFRDISPIISLLLSSISILILITRTVKL